MVCQKGDPGFDAIFDPACTWSFPFGRLAKAVSGLVIVANDPRMTSMQHHVDVELQKEYRLRLNKHLTDEQIEELRGGILVGDDYLVPLRVTPGPKNTHSMWIDLTLLDDSYHRVFGALKALGCEVVKMRRTRIALLNENMVPPGEWRELSGFEISAFDLARFMPGELPPEPIPPPKPRPERPKNGRFSRDAKGGPGGPREGGPRGGGERGSWDRRGPGGGGPGGRRFQPQRRRGEEDPDEREERLRKEAEADAIGNK
jgi:pseudouridine synthase